jgi:hypothetical protein
LKNASPWEKGIAKNVKTPSKMHSAICVIDSSDARMRFAVIRACLTASNMFVLDPPAKSVETPFKTLRNDVTVQLNLGP